MQIILPQKYFSDAPKCRTWAKSAAEFFLNHLAASGRIKAEFSEKAKDNSDAGSSTKDKTK